MNENDSANTLHFPVLQFSQGGLFPATSDTSLTTCSRTALKNGFYSGLLILDSGGKTRTVTGAKKLKGVGPLWGYNFFLNQRIAIELIWSGDTGSMTKNEVESLVLRTIQSSPSWTGSLDLAEITESIIAADSVGRIVEIITSAYDSSTR